MKSKFIFIFILSHLTFGQKMNSDILFGIKNSNLVGDSIQLEKRTSEAYKKMRKAALIDGVELKIISAYRSYERQKMIWNNKYLKYTKEYNLEPEKAINEIIRFSTIPGTSRHHWGTDIDIIDGRYKGEGDLLLAENFKKEGIFFNVKTWLNKNSENFGFYIVYSDDKNRKGFEHEPWHFSYLPVSKKMLESFIKSDLKKFIRNSEIEGSDYFTNKFIDKYIKEHILDINDNLK
tara:strand:+ start:238 stop:939 length:702 start_codon:yes stop_codon:yes gene_type:complete